MGIIWETHFGVFLLVTVFLAGGAGYMSGRSVALTWSPAYNLFVYSAGLACAARFIHFSLFGGTLLSIHYLIVDFIVIAIIAGIAFRLTKTSQMVSQYSWLYERSTPLSWRLKPQSGGPA